LDDFLLEEVEEDEDEEDEDPEIRRF